jgi:protein-S-isoprenylcysteine O-methyltransferase Ste14
MKTNIITLIVILGAMVFLGVHYRTVSWTPMRMAGLVIGLPALGMLIWARIELGGSFAVRPKAQALVTRGIYSKIRNPIYVFSALTIVGVFLYIELPQALWVLAVIIPLQVYRARQEEKVLEAKFGEEYRRYKAGTWL